MKVRIKFPDENLKKLKNINVYLPNGLIKTRVFWHLILKNTNKNSKEKVKTLRKIIYKMYKSVKKYTTQCGHFTIVEIEAEDIFIEIIV